MRLIFYVEGQTEQAYVTRVLATHLANFGVFAEHSILPITGRRRGQAFKGGGKSFEKVRRQFGNLLKQHDQAEVRFTTMFDLYGLFPDLPGRDQAEKLRSDPWARVRFLEKSFADEFADPRVIPHLQLHEFETILLAGPEELGLFLENARAAIDELTAAVQKVGEAELVNDGESTAPSKRIAACFPSFDRLKTTVGVEWAECVGLKRTRQSCPHFHECLLNLESLGSPPACEPT